ncbi:serine hydrolase [Sphingomonas sp.]|uniref:serine hydrolase n=1 Tax=Sphingomonas sp. TaxID=28214 RepID=UPI00286D5C0B|nr:serine hydrolase [Sphingomonas sp.]
MVRSAVAIALLLASTSAAAIAPGFKAKADALLADAYAATGPGAAVIITENGQTVYAAGRGMADVEKKIAITPDTHFRIGSITKQFTAAAILKLTEQGKLSLDDPLSKFLPNYPAPGSSATVRQLLNHTSGVMPYTNIPGFMVEANINKPYTTEQLIAVFKDIPSPSKPGEKWNYNNSGYVLLGAILEKVTGKSWDQAVGDLVTGPLKLTTIRSGIGIDGTAGMAAGYSDEEGKMVPATKIHMSVPHGAGALVGNVGDLATWGQALHHGKVVAPASYAAMISPTTTADGKIEPYGFGLQTGDIRGRREIGHGGGINGFSTDSLFLPEQQIFVAVFANSDSPRIATSVVARKLAALAVGDAYPTFTKAAIDPKTLGPAFGVYDFGSAKRTFFARDAKLFMQREGGPALEVFSAGSNRFFYGPESLSWFELVGAPGATRQIAFYGEGASKPVTGSRTGPPPVESAAVSVPAATLATYVGSYTSAAGTFVFKHEGDGLTVKLGAQPAFPLKATSVTEFEIAQVGARIRFNVKDGKAASITLFQGGQELEGVRQPQP